MTETTPFYNPCPGDIIKDAMDELGWNQNDFAAATGLSPEDAHLILNGGRRIIPEIAERLGKAFSTSAELWLNLDAKYQLGELNKMNSETNIPRTVPVANLA